MVAILSDRNGRLLLQLRDNFDHVTGRGTWSLFGGAVEAGEALGEAMVRELSEEIGITLDCADFAPFGWLQGTSDWRPKVYVSICTRAVEPNEIRLGEGAGFAFFTLEQCRKLELSPLLKAVFPPYFKMMRI